MDERYMYTVCPRIPIRGLVRGRVIVRSENLSLSKDEVLECMKYGRVYRKFYCETNLEAVTPSNIDRLHRKDHLTEEQYKALLENKVSVQQSEDDFTPKEGLEKKEDAEQSPSDGEVEETVADTGKAVEEEISEPESFEDKVGDDAEPVAVEHEEKEEIQEDNESDTVVYSGSIVVDEAQNPPEEGLEKKEDVEQSPSDGEVEETVADTGKAVPKSNSGGGKRRNRQNKNK